MKWRAPIDSFNKEGILCTRRFRYCGDIAPYWGDKGKECMFAKWVARNNSTRYYEGRRKGKERLTQIAYPCGKIELYTGPRGEERLVKIRYPDKCVEYYYGARGRERALYACTKEEDDAMHSDDETPIEWQPQLTAEQYQQRDRLRQAVIERRQGTLREALKTCTNVRELTGCRVPYEEAHDILMENATNALKGKIEAIKHRITGDEYAELTGALEAYMALVPPL